MSIGDVRVRHAREWIGRANAGIPYDFDITVDLDEFPIPRRIQILDLVIAPSAATLWTVSLFSNAVRVPVVGPTYNQVFIYALAAAAADVFTSVDDRPWICYVDDDASLPQERNGTIWGRLEVTAGQPNAGFMIDVFFVEII